MSGQERGRVDSGGERSEWDAPSADLELRVVPLGFYYSVALVLRDGEARLLGLFSDEKSLSEACRCWSSLQLCDPQELELGWADLPPSPFQLVENWQLALSLAVANERLFVGQSASAREMVLTLTEARPTAYPELLPVSRRSFPDGRGSTMDAKLADFLEVPSDLMKTLRAATQQFSPAAEPFGSV